jgi:hypothetical protein
MYTQIQITTALLFSGATAFSPKLQQNHQSTPLHATSDRRRDVLKLIPLVPAILTSTASNAESDLFKPNPLANRMLEKIRIIEQDEADNIVYGGELSSGSSGPAAFDQYVQLLQPILGVERDVSKLKELLNKNGADVNSNLKQMQEILNQPNLDKKAFKKAFNAFADNIYYVDTDRANLYLGGGATPGSTQSIAYLLRNDVLTNIEDMRAEVAYLVRELEKGGTMGEGGLDLDDLTEMVKMANEGMRKYLEVVPPKELEAARAKFG